MLPPAALRLSAAGLLLGCRAADAPASRADASADCNAAAPASAAMQAASACARDCSLGGEPACDPDTPPLDEAAAACAEARPAARKRARGGERNGSAPKRGRGPARAARRDDPARLLAAWLRRLGDADAASPSSSATTSFALSIFSRARPTPLPLPTHAPATPDFARGRRAPTLEGLADAAEATTLAAALWLSLKLLSNQTSAPGARAVAAAARCAPDDLRRQELVLLHRLDYNLFAGADIVAPASCLPSACECW